jgi:hypothetical protein
MTQLIFTVLTTILSLQNLVFCTERFHGVAYLRPFFLTNHPIILTHGSVPLADTGFNLLHKELSSLLI